MMFALPAILDQSAKDLVNPFYCPQDNTGFYTIDYLIVPEETLTNYCEQDSTSFYDITYDVIPEETLTNYCEHTREFCVTTTVIDKTNIEIPSFLPTDSALWLDANDSSTITLVSGAVSEWRDKSGNNRHATQATAGNRPLLVANGLNGTNVIRFDGSDDFLTCGDVLDLLQNGFTSFVVGKRTSGNNGTFYGKTAAVASPNRYSLLIESNILIGLFANNNNQVFNTTHSFSNTDFNILNQELSFNNQTNILRTNSIQRSIVSSINWNGNIDSTYRFLIGSYSNSTDTGLFSGYSLNGDISQIIIFPRVLTQAEREQMEGYLAWSTGLQGNLPVGHPYKNSYNGVTITEQTVCTDFYNFAQAP